MAENIIMRAGWSQVTLPLRLIKHRDIKRWWKHDTEHF